MGIPININFDLSVTSSTTDGIAHLEKIYQGAPYSQAIAVRSADGSYVRDFSTYTVKMQIRLAQSGAVLFELSSENGHIFGTTTNLQIVFPASVTEGLLLTPSNMPAINEIRFVHDIELSQEGVVVERFAQGTGVIVVSTTRP